MSSPLPLDTNSVDGVVVDTVDPFLKSIRALKSFLSSSASAIPYAPVDVATRFSSSEELSALKRRNKSLVFQLNDVLKDAARERELRMSLEQAFDQLTSHRKQLQRHLDEALNNGGKLQKQQSLQSRILSAEAEKLEALKAAEEAKHQFVAEARLKEAAQRRTQELGDILAERELNRKVEEKENQTKLMVLQEQIFQLETNLTKLHRQTAEINEITAQVLLTSGGEWEDHTEVLQAELDLYKGKLKSLQTDQEASQRFFQEERQARERAEEEKTNLEEKRHALYIQLQALKCEVDSLDTNLRMNRHELEESKHALNMVLQLRLAGENVGQHNHDDEEDEFHDQPDMEENEQAHRLDEEGEGPHEVEPDDLVGEQEEEYLHEVEEEEHLHDEETSNLSEEQMDVELYISENAAAAENNVQDSNSCVGLLVKTVDHKRSHTQGSDEDKIDFLSDDKTVEKMVRIYANPEKKRMKPSILEHEDV